jgi:hypothetical protein
VLARLSESRAALVVALCSGALFAAGGCGSDEAGERTAAGGCPAPDGVPGAITELSATNCDHAGEVAAGYFSDGAVPEAWTCTPYPGKREAIQCFQGGCEPPPDADAQAEVAPSFFVDLDDDTSKDEYEHVRTCEPL